MSGHNGSKRAIIAALVANLGISFAKLAGFAITGAASLLAEALHSFADTGNQALLLFGAKRSRKKANQQHPFGYGRESYFWAFVVALVLFSLGGLFALYEGINKFRHPHEVESIGWAYAILIFAVVLEGFSLRTAIVEANHVRAELSLWKFIRASKSPELPVVLLEDLGAQIGLIFALAGLTVGHITGDARYDAMGSIAIGVLLVVIAVILAIEMKSLLTGEGVTPQDDAKLRLAITKAGDVAEIVHLRTQHLGPDELLVAVKVVFKDDFLTGPDVARAIDIVEVRMRAAVPGITYLFVEPGLKSVSTD